MKLRPKEMTMAYFLDKGNKTEESTRQNLTLGALVRNAKQNLDWGGKLVRSNRFVYTAF